METNVQTVTECDAEVRVRPETLCVKSMAIARIMIVDYPFFDDLLAVKKNRYDPNGKRRVWIFDKSKPEVLETFLEIVEERKQARENREQLDNE